MVIWLRNFQAAGAEAGYGAGIEGDVLRGEHLARLVDIDAGYDEMRKECEGALAAARATAAAIVDEAQAQAEALHARAREEYERAAQCGYDEGFKQALTDWHERVVSVQADEGMLGRRRRDRLAELVALAAEEIIASADPAALFTRAAATVERIVADGSPLQVCVHPSDVAAASMAFGEVARGWREAGRAVRLQVRGDAALAPGACVCETDLGAVDASLSLQLEAMRGALARAVQSVANDTDYTDESVDIGPVANGDADDERDAHEVMSYVGASEIDIDGPIDSGEPDEPDELGELGESESGLMRWQEEASPEPELALVD